MTPKTKHEDGEDKVVQPGEVDFGETDIPRDGTPQDIEAVAEGELSPMLNNNVKGLHIEVRGYFNELYSLSRNPQSYVTPFDYISATNFGRLNLGRPLDCNGPVSYAEVDLSIRLEEYILAWLKKEYGEDIVKSGLIEESGLGTPDFSKSKLVELCPKAKQTLVYDQKLAIPIVSSSALTLLRVPDLEERAFYAGIMLPMCKAEQGVQATRFLKRDLSFDDIYHYASSLSMVEKTVHLVKYWKEFNPNADRK